MLPIKEIQERMKELSNDPEFHKKLGQEIRRLKGRNLKRYITKATEISEKEVR